ncbi:MAG: DUF6090 family protein [Gammaproteobacteria bacterium]|nr:DUF6090 family protein [Gammaproteobacteria bacterium]MDH3378794.1 DUF6090 family protein [Gammaproteobacteria bacterium]
MFRLFRKIREEILIGKKTRRYLGYAIGELILVVLGILIALQINNWNEERIEQRQIADYAHALIKDLERDLAMAAVIQAEVGVLIDKIDALAAYIKDKPIEEVRNIDLYYLMRAPFYRPYSWNRTALEQIKSSGALRQMKNQVLAEKIAAYEAFTNHLDGDFDFDRSVGARSVALAGKVVDMNYPNVHEIFRAEAITYAFSFPESEFHSAYKDTNLSLLTDDMEDVKVAVNSYLVLGGYYGIRPRAKIEMPRLATSATELIALLEEEYPE